MIRLYLIEDYKDIYPDISSGALSGALVIDILRREGIADPHILKTENGKPYERDEKIWFSVSHSESIFACAVADHELGLDIQSRGPSDPRKLSDRFFTEDEKAFLEITGAGQDLTDCSGDIGRPGEKGLKTAFLRIWTRKEALVKYRGSVLGDVIGSESVLDRRDVEFIDMDIDREVIGCLCIPLGEERDVEIVRYGADEDRYGCQRTRIDMDARERTIRYLNARMATGKQMRDYLKRKGHEDDEIDPVIEELKEYGYLDDLKYSKLYIEAGFEKGRGIDRIRRELRQKGVDAETIESAESELESIPDEHEMALEIAERILENVDTSEMERKELEALKAKVARRLAGRGFSSSVIYSVIGKLL